MSKIDLKKDLKEFYRASAKKPSIIDVPEGKFITITGRGAPGGPAYMTALNALYSVAYTLKFRCKADGKDFTVMALEGLWWWDDPNITDIADAPPREEWNWKSMIRQPDFVTDRMVKAAKKEVKEKKGIEEVGNLILETFHEGLSAQIMYIGHYSEEEPIIRKLHEFIEENGYQMRGCHHEIYMSDPRRVPPERWKTIIRQPIKKP
ncbi:MAG: GyrI-like domain-containing protein [Candidatus Bathyarchaeota archaeon]|nr:GyrI-like domain-containing protein [Candidatus Bathyarchaeota archaeon]